MEHQAELAHRRYAEIMQDVEDMIDDHSMFMLFLIFTATKCHVPFSTMEMNHPYTTMVREW